MTPIYRTADMETALRVMSERNHHVVALAAHAVKKMIRLRGRSPKLKGVPMLYVMGWKPEARAVVKRWQDEGGVLVYRPLPRALAAHPASDALLFVEAPLQWDRLEKNAATARQEVVIYRPPSWDLHEDAMDHVWPRARQYETLEAVLASLVGRELDEKLQRAREQMPHWSKFAIFTDEEMSAITGWDSRMIRAILRSKYINKYIRFPVYALRYVATHHDIKWAYEVLAKQPSVGKKLHLLRGDNPFEGKLPAFTSAMRMLIRLNYVSREGAIYMVNMDRTKLDFERVEAMHNVNRGRWLKVRNFVDALPEYPI